MSPSNSKATTARPGHMTCVFVCAFLPSQNIILPSRRDMMQTFGCDLIWSNFTKLWATYIYGATTAKIKIMTIF